MATLVRNEEVGSGVYFMKVTGARPGRAGQFYMLRKPGQLDPFFGRPISLFDCEEGTVSFLYRAVGKGTKLFSSLHEGDEIEAQGPYGNGFPLVNGNVTLIGGGIGVAPLYLLAKTLRQQSPERKISILLGYKDEAYMNEAFFDLADVFISKVGGAIMDDVSFSPFGTYYACGPTPMLETASREALAARATLYISSEAHMSCGVGACLGCTCKTKNGNKRVCKDGPVFLAGEVL